MRNDSCTVLWLAGWFHNTAKKKRWEKKTEHLLDTSEARAPVENKNLMTAGVLFILLCSCAAGAKANICTGTRDSFQICFTPTSVNLSHPGWSNNCCCSAAMWTGATCHIRFCTRWNRIHSYSRARSLGSCVVIITSWCFMTLQRKRQTTAWCPSWTQPFKWQSNGSFCRYSTFERGCVFTSENNNLSLRARDTQNSPRKPPVCITSDPGSVSLLLTYCLNNSVLYLFYIYYISTRLWSAVVHRHFFCEAPPYTGKRSLADSGIMSLQLRVIPGYICHLLSCGVMFSHRLHGWLPEFWITSPGIRLLTSNVVPSCRAV